MQQPLIIDQKAMAEKAMADIVAGIAHLQSVTREKQDMNRAQLRRFRAKMRPIATRLRELQRKQTELQEKINALGSSDAVQ